MTTSQTFPMPLNDVFSFFADAGNLERITPPWLRFRILTPLPISMSAETLIDYRIRLSGIPIRWQTEIAVWEPPVRFVDVQKRGPYRLWRHEHLFEETAEGTRVHDCVDYQLFGGRCVHALYVRKSLLRIFEYRRTELIKIFSASQEQ
ncbi:MAG: SRPBCC family protein [Planctomycetaceae bacterium]